MQSTVVYKPIPHFIVEEIKCGAAPCRCRDKPLHRCREPLLKERQQFRDLREHPHRVSIGRLSLQPRQVAESPVHLGRHIFETLDAGERLHQFPEFYGIPSLRRHMIAPPVPYSVSHPANQPAE
ncbi:hypothetical protein C1A38_11365 [Verrucosispora sp. ts21]|nr:hypothetical protein C1A38_11365 [Verrucosispora sp. ts21]